MHTYKSILALISLALTTTPTFAHDDIVVKGKTPKWHAGSPTEDLTKLCQTEKKPADKLSVCSQAIYRYSNIPLTSIPAEAKSQAEYLIDLRKKNPKDDLYIFALHDSHITLGRVALKNNDLTTAKSELIESLQGPSTPALQSIGPRMTLAAELLALGEKQTVLNYLSLVEKAWTLNVDAKKTVANWRKEISAGQVIDFK